MEDKCLTILPGLREPSREQRLLAQQWIGVDLEKWIYDVYGKPPPKAKGKTVKPRKARRKKVVEELEEELEEEEEETPSVIEEYEEEEAVESAPEAVLEDVEMEVDEVPEALWEEGLEDPLEEEVEVGIEEDEGGEEDEDQDDKEASAILRKYIERANKKGSHHPKTTAKNRSIPMKRRFLQNLYGASKVQTKLMETSYKARHASYIKYVQSVNRAVGLDHPLGAFSRPSGLTPLEALQGAAASSPARSSALLEFRAGALLSYQQMENVAVSEGMFTCRRCKKSKCTYYQKQARSADEDTLTTLLFIDFVSFMLTLYLL